MDTTQRRINEQRVEDLERLARKGDMQGVKIMVDHTRGQHVATSASDASRCYVVSVEGGCSCTGYAVWRRCQHHSLLLADLGRLDPEPDPPAPAAPGAPASCPDCGGDGWRYGEDRVAGRLRLARLACWTCDGAGQMRPAA